MCSGECDGRRSENKGCKKSTRAEGELTGVLGRWCSWTVVLLHSSGVLHGRMLRYKGTTTAVERFGFRGFWMTGLLEQTMSGIGHLFFS